MAVFFGIGCLKLALKLVKRIHTESGYLGEKKWLSLF